MLAWDPFIDWARLGVLRPPSSEISTSSSEKPKDPPLEQSVEWLDFWANCCWRRPSLLLQREPVVPEAALLPARRCLDPFLSELLGLVFRKLFGRESSSGCSN